MLVNISYSVDFDEVPQRVRDFLKGDITRTVQVDIKHGLEDAIASLEPNNENIGKTIQNIEVIREFLVKVDMRLNDCSNILKGYQRELLGDDKPVDTPVASPDMSSLQEDLHKIRQTLDGGQQ